MNEDDIVEGCTLSKEATPSKKGSKNNIPDAKYYLVRPRDSKMLFVMDKKPDYEEEPFYKSCKGGKLDINNYLEDHCVDQFDTDNMSSEEDSYLYVLGICPPDNSIGYVFDKPKENKIDLNKALVCTDSYKVDDEVVDHYKLYDWHIPLLLKCEPFKSYIREHLDEFKAPSTPGPTKESKDIPVILNRRLLI